jgi:hypothetical protein
MADDRMRNDDLDRNMGGAGQNKGNYGGGQQTPGRNKQDDDLKTGQRGAEQQGQQGQHGKQGQNPRHIEDDFGTSDNKGTGQGGQNRGNF